MLDDWHWLLLGLGAGYLLGKHGGTVDNGFSLSLSTNTSATSPAADAGRDPTVPAASGHIPYGQPNGSEPYAFQGTYNSDLSGGFPQYIDPGSSGNGQYSGGSVV